jgi:histidinol dehydrogenase
MIQTIDLRGRRPSTSELMDLVPRAHVDVSVAIETAGRLIAEVRERGEDAIREQAERFDKVRPAAIRVDPRDITAAVDALDPAVRAAIEEAIRRVRLASEAQVPPPKVTTLGPGAEVVQRWQPVDRVGLYVPGGKAAYSSSVIMNVVPAQVAGVGSIVLASPAQAEFGGAVDPTVLGAAGILGVEEIYAMGGAGAIGALAYGVPSLGLDPVDVITGPGNIYVVAAKRLVVGRVGIDSEAGPTEILVIADATAEARLVAADLISQAEHDELAAVVLVTDSPELVDAVIPELERQAQTTASSARVRVALDSRQSALVLVDDIQAAAALSNAYAPEHLELQTADPGATLALITNAGAIFLGRDAPVSLGDYLAGSNHVLPTAGQARFASGLNATTFLRSQQLIRYDREGLDGVRAEIRTFSDQEHLPAHGDAVDIRFAE